MWKPLVAGIGAVLAVTTAAFVPGMWRNARGVQPMTLAESAEPAGPFVAAQSTALFVGVRNFTLNQAVPVPFAVDDAVDLAWAFTLCAREPLVPPERIVLVISGLPKKPESRRKLEQLERAKANVITSATQGDILKFAEDQAALAERNGIFIVSLATHGYVHEGMGYFLGSTSLFDRPLTAISAGTISEIAEKSPARRSLLFIDACRERITDGTRAAGPDPRTAAPVLNRMRHIDGQVIFYAAAAGKYAYDDPVAMNGVFTKAIVDGLKCQATATRGVVTVETLHAHVERSVQNWIRRNLHVDVDPATQINMDGGTKNMPLSDCSRPPPIVPTAPHRLETNGSIVTAFGTNDTQLWQRDDGEEIVDAKITDFEEDGETEVVIGARHMIRAFDHLGNPLWSSDTERLPLRMFAIADRYRKERKVVALWGDVHASRISVHTGPNEPVYTWDHRGTLTHITLARPTSLHASKILATSETSVFLVDPRRRKPVWHYNAPGRIVRLEIVDRDNDERNEIAVITAQGRTLFIDFDGKLLRRQ